jgi:hypothetical protein
MKFVLTQSLFQDAFGKMVSKNLKIVRDHATLPETSLSPIGTVGPLGVNMAKAQISALFAKILFQGGRYYYQATLFIITPFILYSVD